MTGHRPFSELAARVNADPERRRRVEANVASMTAILDLMDRLVAAGHARAEVEQAAEAAHVAASSLDSSADTCLSTLRLFVEALGGHLELSAVFPDETLALNILAPDVCSSPAPSVRSA